MRRRILAGVGALAVAAWPHLAGASGDFGCEASWTLGLSGYDCAGTAMLSPRNDTRMNLALLLRERAGAPAAANLSYPGGGWESAGYGHVFLSWDTMQSAFWPQPVAADGEPTVDVPYAGSRCQTLVSGDEAFRTALASAKGLKSGEREALSQARDLVKPACDGDKGAAAWPSGIGSAAGQAFLAYLQGARAFYAEDFATARARFADLGKGRDPWLAETARYMTARTELAAAQAGAIDEWGAYAADKGDKAAAARGQAALAAYLSAYPRGLYAGSAEGLKRRAAWLAGDTTALARAYSGMLATQPVQNGGTPQLLEEVDAKLFFGIGYKDSADAPLLLATWDLMRMRQSDGDGAEGSPKPGAVIDLAAQAPVFARMPDLYGFLQASQAYHVTHDYRRVLALIPDDTRRPAQGPLAFSRQMLRGLALEKLGDANAAGFWQQLAPRARDLYQRPAVELALAMNWERHGALAKVFAADSPVTEPEIRAMLLEHVAGPDLLRTQSGAAGKGPLERQVALFTLLYKELSRGRYDAFGRDLALVPASAGTEGWIGHWIDSTEGKVPLGLFARGKWQEDYACAPLSRTAATLAAKPADVKARLCLAEFYRINGFDDYLANEGKPSGDLLAGSPELFPGKATTRGDLYAAVLADRSATPEDSAYALYRSIMCYAPSGNNSCGRDVPLTQRKAWFQQLKHDHPKSQWTASLRYYW